MNDVEKLQLACRTSLKFLSKEIMGVGVWSAFHDELETFLKDDGNKKLILLPRDHLKSTIVTKCWSIQQVLINPNIRILIANSIWDNARKFLRSIQSHLNKGSVLSQIFGNFESNHWNQDECTIKQRKLIQDAGTWTTTGIEREQTSQHYDLILADDLHGRENVMTKDQREKVKLYYKDLMSLLDPKGRIVVIGTRWSVDDLYGVLLEREGWKSMVRTCYKPNGDVLFPERYTKEKLDELRIEKGSFEFSSQYLNNPVDEERAPFKATQVRYYEPSKLPKLRKFLAIDPAITQKQESDYTAMLVMGKDEHGNIYVLDKYKNKILPKTIVDEVFRLVEKWGLHECGIEAYGYQLSLKYMVQEEQRKRRKFFTVNEMRKPRDSSGKETFILRLQPYFEQGLIFLRKDMTDIVDELVAFPRGKHDDMLDCMAYSLDYLQNASASYTSTEPKEGSYNWWIQHHVKDPIGDQYDQFLSDLRDKINL